MANKACILRPSLTGILTRLEKIDFVVRLKPTNDQRRVFLKLTKEGEQLYADVRRKIDEQYDVIETLMTKEKMQELSDLLDILNQIQDPKQEHAQAPATEEEW